MGKKNKITKEEIADMIYGDYLSMNDLSSELYNKIERSISSLVSSGKAYTYRKNYEMISLENGRYYSSIPLHILASKFLNKYDKNLLKENKVQKLQVLKKKSQTNKLDDPILAELQKYILSPGKYYAILKDSNYAILGIEYSENGYGINTEFTIIGEKWKKFKAKFDMMVSKYIEHLGLHKEQKIIGSKENTSLTFKTFDRMVLTDKHDVIEYLENFKKSIPIFKKYDIIPKISFMLYGVPGTGKSTFAQAIASYLGIGTIIRVDHNYFYNKTYRSKRRSYDDDDDDYGNASGVFLLDDIDTVCPSRNFDKPKDTKDEEKMTNTSLLGDVLAFLDNPPTTEIDVDGVNYDVAVVIATTNLYDKLDPAIKRYGRFDKHMELKNFDRTHSEEMCALFNLKLEDVIDKKSITKDFTISPAELQAKCFDNITKTLKKTE